MEEAEVSHSDLQLVYTIQNIFMNNSVLTTVTQRTVCLCPSKVETRVLAGLSSKEERAQSKICLQTYV
jgi:hypothetical protein